MKGANKDQRKGGKIANTHTNEYAHNHTNTRARAHTHTHTHEHLAPCRPCRARSAGESTEGTREQRGQGQGGKQRERVMRLGVCVVGGGGVDEVGCVHTCGPYPGHDPIATHAIPAPCPKTLLQPIPHQLTLHNRVRTRGHEYTRARAR